MPTILIRRILMAIFMCISYSGHTEGKINLMQSWLFVHGNVVLSWTPRLSRHTDPCPILKIYACGSIRPFKRGPREVKFSQSMKLATISNIY